MTNVALNTAKLATLNAAYATIVSDYAPEGFEATTFKAKAEARDAINAACAAGNLAVTFDGDSAVIVDLLDSDTVDDSASVIGADGEGYGANDDDAGDRAALEGEEGGEVAEFVGLGDGKGKAREWGFVTASAEWLEANPRGGEAREAYRKERRKAARIARKADRAAKEAALSAE